MCDKVFHSSVKVAICEELWHAVIFLGSALSLAVQEHLEHLWRTMQEHFCLSSLRLVLCHCYSGVLYNMVIETELCQNSMEHSCRRCNSLDNQPNTP
jgi:hypothetical protein